MIGLLVASLVLGGGLQPVSGRYETTERMKELDAAWVAVPDKAKRMAAVGKISGGVSALITGDNAEACRDFDEARDILLDHATVPSEAISLRFDPPFAEPKSPAQLHVTWAYMPRETQPVRIAVGSQIVLASPGRSLTITVRPESVVPELAQSPESGVLVPATVGEESRTTYLSVVKGLRARAGALVASKSPEARTLAQTVLAIADGAPPESDVPVIQMLFTAELLDEGRTTLGQLAEVPLVRQGATSFRVAFPRAVLRKAGVPVNVVIALSGSGGFDGEFFDADGQGSAVKMALDRGWVFASPHPSPRAAIDVLEWIRTNRKLKVAHVFLIGHSTGAATVLSSFEGLSPRPTALALFSPASNGATISYPSLPIFWAVGKQDALLSMRMTHPQTNGRRDSVLQEFDGCEHLMTVADGSADAFKFFDSQIH
jgi:hypothetical protein